MASRFTPSQRTSILKPSSPLKQAPQFQRHSKREILTVASDFKIRRMTSPASFPGDLEHIIGPSLATMMAAR
ncbi:hypothetical protein E4U12_003142 [Claviceps purpurea]|nr:hypothetical protein E4U12_003142 [Claviceps purpurea]